MAPAEPESKDQSKSKNDKKYAARAILVFLGALTAYLISLVLPAVWVPAINSCSGRLICYDWLGPVLVTGALFAGLIAVIFTFRASQSPKPEAVSSGVRFPQGETVLVLIWLIALFIIYFYLLLMVIVQEAIDSNTTFWLMLLDHKMVLEASVAFLAAGLGSTVSTSFSYLRHASTNADWKSEYTPWYILRPLQGSVLGVIFYWLLKGGILAVLPAKETQGYVDLDPVVLAGVCSLVGMFSRRAMIKLRETFKTIFSIKNDDSENLVSDPEDER